MELAGRAALVTGGASGLGAATVAALAAAGARVAILDLDMPGAETVARATGAIALEANVADEDHAREAIEEARAAHGPASILVNCAGIGGRVPILADQGPMPLGVFVRTVRVNLVGSFNMMRLAAADMARLPAGPGGARGVIVNVGSIAATEGQLGQAAYAASKAGVAALTLPAARELGQLGIRVLCIAPGIFATPLFERLAPGQQARLGATVPYPTRAGRPGRVRPPCPPHDRGIRC